MGRDARPRLLTGDRLVLSVDWQWGDRYLRAGLAGSAIGHDRWGRTIVLLDCFTEDSVPLHIDSSLLEAFAEADHAG